jgi:hypothetical protein
MRLRIAIWAVVGALVVLAWTVFLSAVLPGPLRGLWATFVDLTCPIALARQHSLSIYFVLLTNASTYALAGTAVEMLQRHFKHARLISN